MSESLHSFLQKNLQDLQQQHLLRVRRHVDSAQAARICVDGQWLHNFCSNDYLGLANHTDIKTAMQKGIDTWGVGSGASHLVSGHTRAHAELEAQLAELTVREAALVFSTGFMANVAIINALMGKGDRILADKLNHASLIDGALSSGAQFQRYRHNDLDALERLLNSDHRGHCLVVTDGVFSMDGDVAPLGDITSFCHAHDAWLMVDDAHGFGVLGARGAGLVEQSSLSADDVPVLMCTLGKAVGTYGAFVAGHRDLIDYLLQKARPYIYSTAMPSAVAVATSKALQIMQAETWRRQHLQTLIAAFRARAAVLKLPLMPSQTPIQPLLLGDNARALACSQRLKERGFLVSAIRPPTVPPGTARLRITLSAAHDLDAVCALVDTLADILVELAPAPQ